MKTLKRLSTILFCLVFVAVFYMSFLCIGTQNQSGNNSSITLISDREKQTLLDLFGACTDIECLMKCVENHSVQNFSYNESKIPIIQHFDFRELVESQKGICFDFACFFKCCCLVWAEHQDVELKVYVVDVEYDFFEPRHSYNVVQMSDGRNYYLDITNSIYEVQMLSNSAPGFELFYESIENYAARYGEKVLFLR